MSWLMGGLVSWRADSSVQKPATLWSELPEATREKFRFTTRDDLTSIPNLIYHF